MINIFQKTQDDVIKSTILIGDTTYAYALENLYPLIDRLEFQRKKQDIKFYDRLKRDIKLGCVMPAITIAFVINDDISNGSIENQTEYINHNIEHAYILDGLQRLNTLNNANMEHEIPLENKLLLNIILSTSHDNLLYRMITLNNGQKPMTPRHQIEVLTKELFDFSKYENFLVQTEKEYESKRLNKPFKLSALSKAYLAYLANSVNNENTKIIAEEMDKIIVGRIMDRGVPEGEIEFDKILKIIDEKCISDIIKDWLRMENNLIGFCHGIKTVSQHIETLATEDFEEIIDNFEKAFQILNVSKIKLGQTRRELVYEFFSKFEETKFFSLDQLKEFFVEKA